MFSLLSACAPSRDVATPKQISTSTQLPSPTVSPTPTPTPSPSPTPQRNTFDGASALELVREQTDFGYRPSGSAAGWTTGDWIIEQVELAGWHVETQEFMYQGVKCRNIIAKMPGSEGEPIALLGAHYDTRRRADQDPHKPDEPVMGANDGASGTAVLIELAYTLEHDRIPFWVWLAFFDAEDNGRLDGWDWIVGSSYMASQLEMRPEFVIIADMIGDADQQIYFEHNSDPVIMKAIWQVASELGYADTIIPEYRHSMLDDHTPFVRLGIPAVDMIDFDYPYWHTTADTLDKVSADSLERVGRTIESYLESSLKPGVVND